MCAKLGELYKLLIEWKPVPLELFSSENVGEENDIIIKEEDVSHTPLIMLEQTDISESDITRRAIEITPLQLRKILWAEEREKTLQKLPKHFYTDVIVSIRLLKLFYRKEGKEELLREANVMRELLLDLMRKRIAKILRLASVSSEVSREAMELMTIEERIIYYNICKLISSWEEAILKHL